MHITGMNDTFTQVNRETRQISNISSFLSRRHICSSMVTRGRYENDIPGLLQLILLLVCKKTTIYINYTYSYITGEI